MQNQTITNQPSNNQVTLVGTITSKYTFSHEVFGEGFYTMQMHIKRNSGAVDTICCMISDRLADISCDPTGCRVKVHGQFRSYNQQVDGKSHLRLTVFIREIENVEETQNSDYNEIELHGFLCKDPIYRVTPKGYEITDLLLAVNRAYRKSDYIPCICWGRNAKFARQQLIGEKVYIKGRIQSRVYYKRKANGKQEEQPRIAYEVSISSIQKAIDE